MPTNITKPSVTVSVTDVVSIRPEHYLKYYPQILFSPRQMGKYTNIPKSVIVYLTQMTLIKQIKIRNPHFVMLTILAEKDVDNPYIAIKKTLDSQGHYTSQHILRSLLPDLL